MQIERVLKRRHVIALAFGAMVGWSWILLSGLWIERAGTLGAAAAFMITGVAMVLIALTYAELAAALPQIGGEHVYTERAFGRGISFLCTWSMLLGYMSVIAFEAVALPFALAYLFPGLNVGHLWTVAGYDVYLGQVVIGITAAVVLTTINIRGLRTAAGVQGFATTLVVLVGLLLLLGSGRAGEAANMEPWFAGSASGIFGVIVMVPLMFLGFDVIPQAAAEIDLPPQRIGALVVYSVLCAVAWYIVILLAVGWILDADARAAAALPTARAASVAWSANWAGDVLVCGGIAGIVTTWNAFLVGASRLAHVLATERLLPAWLAAGSDERAAPVRSLWLICALSCLAPWFGRPALIWLVDAGSLGVIVAYTCVALAFLRLRRTEPALVRPYRVPAGAWVGRAAAVLSLAIGTLYLPGSPSALVWPQEWLICGCWGLAGILLFVHAARAQ